MMRIIILMLLLLAFNPQVERGYVLDSQGNGISVKADDSPVDEVYNYIHYQKNEAGTEMLSFFLYDPRFIGKHEDDTIFRQDFVLSKGNNISSYKQYISETESPINNTITGGK